jgi:hypothetical protein
VGKTEITENRRTSAILKSQKAKRTVKRGVFGNKTISKFERSSTTMKKAIGFILTLVMVMTVLPFGAMTASAASVAFPSLSASAYCEFIAAKNILVYRDTALKTRGTSSPAQSYAAEIYNGDTCQILQITEGYIQLKYPTSSGLKTGYIKRSDLINVSAPSEKITAQGSANTNTKAGNAYYGYTEKGDTVYNLGTSGSYTAIIYAAKSGSRAYKYAFVLTSEYSSKIATPPHTHSFGSWATKKAATCTADGTQERKCSCGASETRTVAATGHSWSAWVVTKAATASATGTETHTCSICKATETRTIAKVAAKGLNIAEMQKYAKGHALIETNQLCAEFVYRCLAAGGITLADFNDKYTAITGVAEAISRYAPSQLNYIVNKTNYKVIWNPNLGSATTQAWVKSNVKVGDLIYYDYKSGAGYNKSPEHVVICTGYDSDGYPLYSGHNSAAYNQRIYTEAKSQVILAVVKMS